MTIFLLLVTIGYIFVVTTHVCDYNFKSYANGVFTGIIIFLKFILRRHVLAEDEMCAF